MLLSANQLHYSVSGFALLRDINLNLPVGQVTAIVGPNGAGKTTLLRLLCGELKPTSGEILLAGRALEQWPMAERARKMAVLPQASSLNFPFTAREVVALGRTPHATGAIRDQAIINAALKRVDGSYLQQRSYTLMSGGEQQRVQLARVLAQIWEAVDGDENAEESVLILDEPTSAFDLAHQQMMLQMMRQMAALKVGLVVVLHDLNLATRCADQMVVLHQGGIAAMGEPSDIVTPALINDVFGVAADVVTHQDSGKPMVLI